LANATLRVTLAIGRVSPTQEWAPYACGVERLFWVQDQARRHPVYRYCGTTSACDTGVRRRACASQALTPWY